MLASIRPLALGIALTAVATPALALWSTDPGVDNIVSSATRDQRDIHAIPDGEGGIYVAWEDTRAATGNFRIYVQRLSADGDPMWTVDGVLAGDGGATQLDPRIARDGAGGLICVWNDHRVASGVYGQRFAGDGTRLWASDGLEICDESYAQYRPDILADPAGGVFVAWNDTRNYNQEDIYGQRVALDGSRQWATEGRALFTSYGLERNVHLASDGAGGVIMVVNDLRYTRLLAKHYDSAGTSTWGTVIVSTENTNYPALAVVADGFGGVIATWSSTWYDLKAQRLDASGAKLWNGGADVEIGTAPGSKFGQSVSPDGNGGAYVGYADNRGSNIEAISHLAPDGTQPWGIGYEVGPRLPSIGPGVRTDADGNAIIAWPASGNAFLAQKYDPSGTEQWTPGGVTISTTGSSAYVASQICGTPDDASIIVFERPISPTNVDVHAKKLLGDGTLGDILAVNDATAPSVVTLAAHPNPFRTHVRLALPGSSEFVRIVDAAGRQVRRLDAAGAVVAWDGRDDDGVMVSPGVYFARSHTGRRVATTKIVRQ